MRKLAARGADLLVEAHEAYRAAFTAITRRAPGRFSSRDWRGMQGDALERLELYRVVLDPAVARLSALLGEHRRDPAVWSAMKEAYARRIARHPDLQLAETFFNSASRRVFDTIGVDPSVEFVSSGPTGVAPAPARRPTREYDGALGVRGVLARILEDHPFEAGYEDAARDVALAAARVEAHLAALFGSAEIDGAEVLVPVFFRNKGAYVVGRLRRGARLVPLVLALLNPEGRVVLDAVLLLEDEASIVFSFTRSYFHVDAGDEGAIVAFLKSIMPLKPIAELYIALGWNKHGKTELYRDLRRHLSVSGDLLIPAPGESGMVMVVFTLSSYDLVFKVIRDSFGYPKTTTRRDVMEKYRLVFRQSRAGRLVDVQEFEHLEFPRDRFSEEALGKLLSQASESVRVDGERVVVRHLYTERRLVPLNLYLARVPEAAGCAAVVDFGDALRELAATNVFPGDLLLKNFGVTRHGRVVFYDYDELCFLTDCNFRPLPEPVDAETTGEPPFYVGENDVFPEEFVTFLGLRGAHREAFLAAHRDLLDVRFWLGMQERVRSGEIMDVFPYPRARRLHEG